MALYPERDRLDKIESRYVLVNLAARRATQISHDHAPPLIDNPAEHPLTTALLEIADGAVEPVYEIAAPGAPSTEYGVSEFGAGSADSLDAAFVDFFGEDQMIEEDVEGDLGAFGAVGGEARVERDEDTISLSDLADEEEEQMPEDSEESAFDLFSLEDDEEKPGSP